MTGAAHGRCGCERKRENGAEEEVNEPDEMCCGEHGARRSLGGARSMHSAARGASLGWGGCRSRGHSGPTEERGVPARTELPTHTSGKSQEQRPVREGLQGRGGTSLAQETSSRPGRRERTVGGRGEGIRGPAAQGSGRQIEDPPTPGLTLSPG